VEIKRDRLIGKIRNSNFTVVEQAVDTKADVEHLGPKATDPPISLQVNADFSIGEGGMITYTQGYVTHLG
jgi:hypothetical protein